MKKTDNDPVITNEVKIEEFKQKLMFYGYDGRPAPEGKDFSDVIHAFQIHFLPWNICGLVTEQSVQALDILIQKKFGI